MTKINTEDSTNNLKENGERKRVLLRNSPFRKGSSPGLWHRLSYLFTKTTAGLSSKGKTC